MDAQEQFEGFLSKYEPGVAAEAKKSLAKLRKLIPNAIEMVYDNYNALVVGFCPGMRPSEAVISIAVMPEWVSLCFLQGAGLPDPEKRLLGSGNVARYSFCREGSALHAYLSVGLGVASLVSCGNAAGAASPFT